MESHWILEKATLIERNALRGDLHATRRTEDDMENRLVRYNPDIGFPSKVPRRGRTFVVVDTALIAVCLCIVTS